MYWIKNIPYRYMPVDDVVPTYCIWQIMVKPIRLWVTQNRVIRLMPGYNKFTEINYMLKCLEYSSHLTHDGPQPQSGYKIQNLVNPLVEYHLSWGIWN